MMFSRNGRGTTMTALALGLLLPPTLAAARTSGDPIRLVWEEGDVAGTSAIYGKTGDARIGTIEYHQVRRGDVLTSVRVAHFADGSSDEDSAEARVAGTLVALSGRSIIRGPDGEPPVDLTIDVAGGHLAGTLRHGASVVPIDQHEQLPPATYWGPLVFLALKNFDANVEDGRLVFRTVAPTPQPLVLDMAFTLEGRERVERAGVAFDAVRYELQPTIHWAVDPVVRLVAPSATFWLLPGEPPALVGFQGPRNYARQPMRLQ